MVSYTTHRRASCFHSECLCNGNTISYTTHLTCGLLPFVGLSCADSVFLHPARSCELLQQNCTIVRDACTFNPYRVCYLTESLATARKQNYAHLLGLRVLSHPKTRFVFVTLRVCRIWNDIPLYGVLIFQFSI